MSYSVESVVEPTEAFPYTPPTEEIKAKYAHIFDLTDGLPPRLFKILFDKVVAALLLTIVWQFSVTV